MTSLLQDHHDQIQQSSSVVSPFSSADAPPTISSSLVEPLKDDADLDGEGGVRFADPPARVGKLRWLASRAKETAVSFLMGLIFAFALERAGVLLPATIRSQMVFTREVMLKMWLAATITSAVVFAATSVLSPGRLAQVREGRVWRDKGILTDVVGGFIQGTGMGLTGACPGMLMGQMGAGYPDAYYTFIGALLGAGGYSLLHPLIEKALKRDFERTLASRISHGYFDEIFKKSYPLAALALAAAFAIILLAFELRFSWKTDLVGVQGSRDVSTGLLNPTAAGVIVGSLQIPALFLLTSSLGTSTGYSVLTSQWVRVAPEAAAKTFTYASKQCRSRQYWQVVYGLGAVLGGYLSVNGLVLPPPAPTLPNGVGVADGLVGGFLLMFGARLAGGCASGHGLSGLSLMSVHGFIVVPAMYAGGIVTVFIARAARGEGFLLA